MAHDPSPEDVVFLSTMPAGPGHRRLALAVVLIAATLFSHRTAVRVRAIA